MQNQEPSPCTGSSAMYRSQRYVTLNHNLNQLSHLTRNIDILDRSHTVHILLLNNRMDKDTAAFSQITAILLKHPLPCLMKPFYF